MARYTGPKHKLARREGVNILGKTSQSLERKINIPPGAHGAKRRRGRPSEYGIQLREKQKLKRIYGLLEKQFSKYVAEAERSSEKTDEMLTQLLELRLDNVVYRLGFANSRAMARQMVSHGHILVNDKRVTIPSYRVSVGDKISVHEKFLKNEINKNQLDNVQIEVLDYLAKDKVSGELKRVPTREEIANPVDYQLVIEFYSR